MDVTYQILATRSLRVIAETNDPQTVAFYANVGYMTRVTS